MTNVLKATLQQALVLRVLIAIRVHVTDHLLHLSLRFFHRQRLGDLYSRLTNDIENTHKALTHPHARESLGLRELRGRAKRIEVFRVLRSRADQD